MAKPHSTADFNGIGRALACNIYKGNSCPPFGNSYRAMVIRPHLFSVACAWNRIGTAGATTQTRRSGAQRGAL